MDALLDDLGLGFSIPFVESLEYPGKVDLCKKLRKEASHRVVVEPILPRDYKDWTTDDSSPSSGEEIAPNTFDLYESVRGAFGPAGSTTSVHFKMSKEGATTPAVREMVLVTERGAEILRIKPKSRLRRRVSRGCVEVAISEWMRSQQELPLGDPERYNVQSELQPYVVDGEAKQVAVWLWRGLEQDVDNPKVFKIFL